MSVRPARATPQGGRRGPRGGKATVRFPSPMTTKPAVAIVITIAVIVGMHTSARTSEVVTEVATRVVVEGVHHALDHDHQDCWDFDDD